MKHILLFLAFIFFSIASFSQEWNRDSIISKLKVELKDSTYEGYRYHHRENLEIIKFLEDGRNDSFSLFPFSPFDSVVQQTFGTWENGKKQSIAASQRLNEDIEKAFLRLINNPLYFDGGECGTAIPESKFVFFFRGKEIASIVVACAGSHFHSTPYNILNRGVGLNDEGWEIFYKLGLY